MISVDIDSLAISIKAGVDVMSAGVMGNIVNGMIYATTGMALLYAIFRSLNKSDQRLRRPSVRVFMEQRYRNIR